MSEPGRAIAAALRQRGRASLDRALALALVAPADAAALLRQLDGVPPARRVEVQALTALLVGGEPPEGGGGLAAAARLARAAPADVPAALREAHDACAGPDRVWLPLALAAVGLRRVTAGELPVRIDPLRYAVDVAGQSIDLGQAHRRFALLWALSTASAVLPREVLFERVWGRALLDTDDGTALQTTVSRTRAALPEGVSIVGLPGGSYALTPSWAVYVPVASPPAGQPLAPLGRDLETLRTRALLVAGGRACLVGPAGSGTSRIAAAIGDAWPTGWVRLDLRHGTMARALQASLGMAPEVAQRALDGRLLVVDHGDPADELPWPHRPVLWAGSVPREGVPRVDVGPLAPRDAAALAKALGIRAWEGPVLPLDLRTGGALETLAPSAIELLRRLLGAPGGVPTAFARRLGGVDFLTTLDDLDALVDARCVRRRGDRLVAEDGLRLRVAAVDMTEALARWAARHADEADRASLEQARRVAEHDLDAGQVALRRLVARDEGTPAQRAWTLLSLAEVAARSARPDPGLELELARLAGSVDDAALDAALAVHHGERALWRGEVWEARTSLRQAAVLARRAARPALEARAWIEVAEARLRLGVSVDAALREAEATEAAPRERMASLRAAQAIETGDLLRADDLLQGVEGPHAHLRRGQLQLALGGVGEALAEAAAGFVRTDRRWLGIALGLQLLGRWDDEVLARAVASVAPEDVGSRAALSLLQAAHAGRREPAEVALRLPGHDDVSTFTWDLVRFCCARWP